MVNHYERTIGLFQKEMLKSLESTERQDFKSFTEHPFIQSLAKQEDTNFAMKHVTIQILYHLFLMKKNGEKIFLLEKDIVTKLRHTELRGIPGSMLRTPYKTQLFVLPDDFTDIALYSPSTGRHYLESFYVAYINQVFRIMAVGRSNNANKPGDDTVVYFKMEIETDRDLKEQLKELIEKSTDDPIVTMADGQHNLDNIEALFNLALNTLLYITSPEADLYQENWNDVDKTLKKKKDKDRKQAIQSLKARNRFLRVRVGHNIRLNSTERQAYNTGRKTDTQTLVMGHWQSYWYGKRDETREKKLKWKEPYWKGSGELSNIPHKVD